MRYEPLIKKIADERRSAFRKYQDLFVGSESVPELVKYEAVTSLVACVPGALGIYLRSKLYRLLLGRCGKSVFFGKGITLRVPSRIRLGSNVVIDDNVVLDAKGDPKASFIQCGDEIEIGRNTILSCKGQGSIVIGDLVALGRNALLSALNRMVIGNSCSIGPYCCLLASGHGWADPDKSVMLQDREVKAIVIEENVWLGAHVTVLDGVTIGKGSVIAVGSVVTKDIPPFVVAGGVPARVVAHRERGAAKVPQQPKTVACAAAPGNGRTCVDATERSRPRRVTQAVFRAIQEVNKQLPKEQQLPQSIDAVLFEGVGGRAGGLDSLGLLNLIVTLEQEIEAEFGIGLTLTREDIINEQERPFETAGALVNYVCSLLEEKACE